MLRSLHKRLVIALCPTQVAVVESGRGWRAQTKRLGVFSCLSVTDEPEWQTPLTALQQWLEENKPARMDVEVVLSDRFVRYAVIPWSEAVQKRSEIAALSRIHFETIFGEPSAQWEIQSDCDVYGKASLGCALDKGFISALQELCAVYKLRPISLKPYFVRAFNRWRSRIGKSDALLAVVESGYCVLAGLKKGEWHSIRSFRLGQGGKGELPVLIQREILLQGMDEQSVIYFHAAEQDDAVPTLPDFGVTTLEFPTPMTTQPSVVNMALCGIV